jgi:hypothetical protein
VAAQPGESAPARSPWWWLLCLPLAAAAWLLWRRSARSQTATAAPAVRKPIRTNGLQQQLARAQTYKQAGDMAAFYDEIYRAIWQYVGSAGGGASTEFSRQQLEAQLSARWGEDKAVRLLRLLAACERALFSGQPAGSDADADWAEAQMLLGA